MNTFNEKIDSVKKQLQDTPINTAKIISNVERIHQDQFKTFRSTQETNNTTSASLEFYSSCKLVVQYDKKSIAESKTKRHNTTRSDTSATDTVEHPQSTSSSTFCCFISFKYHRPRQDKAVVSSKTTKKIFNFVYCVSVSMSVTVI
ncbi:hypothetical protein DFA_05345 [Cavenderia fasciculata]|uniref:Uncharacterized protein n=1 Tax=Cavenderia fasciculata TaxID=261658 RepID=F4PKZ1_CACFS|nr:uncharacterized protein DFA_05345 [Cavenderia fasciculata]EGG23213.1 hypothetical protein DFA_05345 [Cavenderia fasciculata]|eukprot:XP_004361064.1 hypothetical protein DFA_05345 [Cavenderia fasciculata]